MVKQNLARAWKSLNWLIPTRQWKIGIEDVSVLLDQMLMTLHKTSKEILSHLPARVTKGICQKNLQNVDRDIFIKINA
jgi:hypothetical protein